MQAQTSGADARGHLRGESVALPRRPSRRDPSPDDKRRNRPADAFSFLEKQERKRTVYQLAAALVAGFFLLQFARPALHRRHVASLSRSRKAALSGVGESHVLPRRYMTDEGVGADELPVCKRVLLFVFTTEHDFSSEIEAYLRASVIAAKLGYTFLADDQYWQYGSLREYFLPRQIHCRPPTDWFLQAAAVPLGSRRWANQDRVWYSRAVLSTADDWLRSEVLDVTALEELRESPSHGILKEGDTLPPALEEVFADFVAAGRELFARPNDQLAILIRSLRMELGLGEGGLRNRKHSPTWGGNKREGDPGSRQAVEDVAEDEHDFEEAGGAERSDRGPIIGLQVESGANAASLKILGATPGSVGNLTAIVQGVNDAVRRLSKSTIADPGYSRAHPLIFRGLTPSLLVMTNEDRSFRALAATKLTEGYAVQRTPAPPATSLRQWKATLKLDGGNNLPSLEWVHDPKVFRTLPRALRVHLTRYFLRDLITLANFADAFVVSGSSSTGRLALLCSGVDGVVGPRGISGKGRGGRVRSFDAPWYPTSTPEALFDSAV